jgi:hypothetical protein
VNQDEVVAALIAHVESLLEDDYDGLVVTGSREEAFVRLAKNKPFVLITVDDSEHIAPPEGPTDRWRFLVNLQAGPRPNVQATTETAQDADRLMSARFRERFNSRANYDALKAVGVYLHPQSPDGGSGCKTWPEDQREDWMKNPHEIRCTTY